MLNFLRLRLPSKYALRNRQMRRSFKNTLNGRNSAGIRGIDVSGGESKHRRTGMGLATRRMDCHRSETIQTRFTPCRPTRGRSIELVVLPMGSCLVRTASVLF